MMPLSRCFSLVVAFSAAFFLGQPSAQTQSVASKPVLASTTAVVGDSNPLLEQFGLTAVECPSFSKLAADYQNRFSSPMKAWAGQHLAALGAKKVVYPFSGADVVTAMALFPAVEHLVMVADQWPEYSGSRPGTGAQAAKECETMSYFARYGYFRTNDLEGKNSVKPRFIKLMMYSIALSDAKVSRIDYLVLGADGAAAVHSALPAVKPDGLRFTVSLAGGREVKIDYVRMDLSNNGLQPGKPFHAFMKSQMDGAVLIKSASHLLQKSYFSALADIIVEGSGHLVQDETGLDIELFRRAFEIRSYGKFNAPHPLWHDSASGRRLSRYFQEQSAMEPLPFTIGYEKKSGSVLLVGTRKRS